MSSSSNKTDGPQKKTKSYRGCRRCKQARRRCGEERPTCAFCEKTGFDCEYDIESLFRIQKIKVEGGKKSISSISSKSSRSAHPSPSTANTSPGASNAYTVSCSPTIDQPGERLLTPNTAPREGKPDPFADLFGHADYDENNAPDTAELSSFLSSSSTAPITLERRPSDEDHSGSSYFNFFLQELSQCFPYVNVFPWTAATLFSSSNHNPALRQSVLAVAALIADREAKGAAEALTHLQTALQLLRSRLSAVDVDVDDGLAISSFLLAHFSMMLGDHTTAKRHLRGMSIVLRKLDHSEGPHKESVPNPLTTDKLTMLIWRMAIRVDFISSIACGKEPVLPNLPDEEEGIHRQWTQSNADKEASPDNADWAEAWMVLDALMHRTCHAASTVNALRSRPGSASETRIQRLMNALTKSHQQWWERRVIRKSEETERVSELYHKVDVDRDGSSGPQITSPFSQSGSTESGFLEYTPARIFDPFFASRLNNWRAIRLHISLIREPMWGLYDGSRFVCAVDLCRTHAALGAERNFLGAEKSVGLYLAGVVFGGPDMYAKESQWVLEQLGEIKKYHPIASTLANNLKRIWKLQGNYWESIKKVSEEQNL